jgi:enamine deaminase RidA (YjgF/YER057c/UK114 family)
MTRKLTEWHLQHGQTENLGPSSGCRTTAVPMAPESKYDFHELEAYPENIGWEVSMGIRRHEVGPIMSKAVEDGGTVYLAGLTADDTSGSITEQTKQVLAKIDKYLADAGTDKSKLLTAMILVSDIGLKPAMNEVWNAWIDPENPPTRACVGVQLEGATNVEIIVTAKK